ncbi:hypothetical protein [Saccharomonospora sp.]|uniref:hypothetical protein n=1 Tax=Saccharomonospora sp. TaxID=33913 RepID=UPI0026268A6F|nr:hypothetical protein [Saccharomonospora sp.]
MDPLTLAGQAVSYLCGYLTQVASGLVQRTQDSAAEALYNLVATRLRRTPVGQQILGALEADPGNDQAAHDAKQVLATEAQHDQAFAAALGRAVQSVWHTPGGVSGSTVEQVNVTASGATMKNSAVTGTGNIDQSRRQTKISFGGVSIIAAIVLLGGTGSVIAVSTGGVDANSIGDAPGEEGVRETAKAVIDAFSSGDSELFCDLLLSEKVIEIEAYTGRSCSENFDVLMERIPPEWEQQFERLEVLSVDMDSRIRAVAEIGIPLPENSFEIRMENEMGRWRVDFGEDNNLPQFGVP